MDGLLLRSYKREKAETYWLITLRNPYLDVHIHLSMYNLQEEYSKPTVSDTQPDEMTYLPALYYPRSSTLQNPSPLHKPLPNILPLSPIIHTTIPKTIPPPAFIIHMPSEYSLMFEP